MTLPAQLTLPAHLGVATHLEAIRRALGSLAGLELLDVGCGESTLPRDLAQLGASCSGVDPFMPAAPWQQVAQGRWRVVKAAAESLPMKDASIDGALFLYSLHHVPAPSLAPALAEVRRVLKPGGFLYVAEPVAEGEFNDLLAIFHDEREVRARAQRALADAVPWFATHAASGYTARRNFPDFAAFAKVMQANVRFNDYAVEDVVAPQVQARFEHIVARNAGVFDQPVKVDVLARA